MTRFATLSNISAKNALASPARNHRLPLILALLAASPGLSVVQPGCREERLARERRPEAERRDRREDHEQKERGPRVPGRGVGRQRESQKVSEVILDEQNEQS